MRIQLFLVLSLILFNSCSSFEDLTLRSQPNIEVRGIKDGMIEMDLIAIIENPNSQSFKVKSANFDIFLNDSPIGKSSMNKAIKIDGNSIKEYIFPVKVKLGGDDLSLGMLLGGLFKSAINLKVEGEVKAGTFLINQNFPVEWEDRIKL